MQHFTREQVGMNVVDARGEPLGRIAGIEDGRARLEPSTGVESRMEAAADPDHDALEIRAGQVDEVTDDYVRVELDR